MPELKKNKSLYSHSLLIFFVRFFSNLATVAVTYYFSHHLAKEANGIYLNFWTHLYLTSGIAGLGISLFIFSYPPETLRYLIAQIKRVHYVLYLLFLVLVGILFTYLQQDGSGSFAVDGYIPFLFFMAYIFGVLLEAILIVLRRFVLLLFVSFVYAVVFVLLHYSAAQSNFDLNHLLLTLLPFLILKIVLFVPFVYAFIKKTKSEQKGVADIKGAKALWFHLSFFNLYSVLFQWGDKYVLTFVLSAGLSAVYINGSVGIPFLPLAFSAVSSALLMQMNNLSAQGTVRQKIQLLHYSSGLLSSVAFPVFCYLFVFGAEVILVMCSDKYQESIPIFLCTLLVIPIRSFDFIAVLQNHHKGKIINFGAAMDLLLAVALMYPMYQWIGLPGVALSFVISTYGQCLFYLYHSGKVMGVSMWAFIPWKTWLIKLLLFGTLAFVLHEALHSFTPLLRLAIGGIIIAIFALLTLKYEHKKQPELV